MVLNKNVDNYFEETEQVAFCVANVVRGIDFTDDPLLQGRIHSYFDTQVRSLQTLSRPAFLPSFLPSLSLTLFRHKPLFFLMACSCLHFALHC